MSISCVKVPWIRKNYRRSSGNLRKLFAFETAAKFHFLYVSCRTNFASKKSSALRSSGDLTKLLTVVPTLACRVLTREPKKFPWKPLEKILVCMTGCVFRYARMHVCTHVNPCQPTSQLSQFSLSLLPFLQIVSSRRVRTNCYLTFCLSLFASFLFSFSFSLLVSLTHALSLTFFLWFLSSALEYCQIFL